MEPIESILQRPKLYNNVDGVGELGIGAMLLWFGLLFWVQMRWNSAVLHNGTLALLLVGCWGIDRGIKTIKKRITYPRTGFVEYRKRDVWRTAALAAVLGAVVAAAIAFAARSHWSLGEHLGLTAPLALLGLIPAAAYAYGIARAVRWKWVVASAMAVCSVVMAMLPADWAGVLVGSPANARPFTPQNVAAWDASMFVYGAVLLISGATSFVLYMRHTQPPVRTAE